MLFSIVTLSTLFAHDKISYYLFMSYIWRGKFHVTHTFSVTFTYPYFHICETKTKIPIRWDIIRPFLISKEKFLLDIVLSPPPPTKIRKGYLFQCKSEFNFLVYFQIYTSTCSCSWLQNLHINIKTPVLTLEVNK